MGTDEKSAPQVIDAVYRDVKELKKKNLDSDSLHLFKQQVRGGVLLAADDMESRMTSLGVNEMNFGDYVSVESVVESIEKVKAADVRDLANELLTHDKMAVLVMGEVNVNKMKKLIAG